MTSIGAAAQNDERERRVDRVVVRSMLNAVGMLKKVIKRSRLPSCLSISMYASSVYAGVECG